ncbi:branched-chain amino acid transport system ATP-binding protein [Tessaracoccus bendigoensis DSM 12906]|uniref:Branched-chain amino acid transport system ATP-binding protein n=1 Tax=Tessaracoccus bendigoensis DSM 12906 TaxID=1123357 RepID=A0A1M6F153_9ACTN|nr:ABC transporter ATP-binding protein [Tessaracoccus bendigoensis]SHI91464.1 branched-chain amino acid transport system ATP-binding protein [Tessaracoccus bendigoensis DSM 12906]
MSLLNVSKLTRNFGGLTAVFEASLHIDKGELIGLIGPNGAGKTTLFNVLTGVYPPSSGTIELEIDGHVTSLGGKSPHRICAAGVGRTFQNIRLFKDLTVLENVAIALQQNVPYNLFAALFHLPPYGASERRIAEESRQLLDRVGLGAKAGDLARNLSYGEQRHLEIARALATKPSLLLLDEPAAGMNPAETAELTGLIAQLREEFGLTILLIEHDMSLVMKICERIYVLDHGIVIASGTPSEVRNNPKVIEAYLGEEVPRA